MEATDSEENKEEEDTEEYMMFHVASKDKKPYRVEINWNGFSTSMEVNTGSAATTISEETRNETDSSKAANIHW